MLALKGVLLAAAAAAVLGLAHPAEAEVYQASAAPLVARCAYFNPQAQLDPSCVVDARRAPRVAKGKAPRLPRLRVVQVGARIRAHLVAEVQSEVQSEA